MLVRGWPLLLCCGLAPVAVGQDAPAPAPTLDNPHQIEHWATRPEARELLAHADAEFGRGAQGWRPGVEAWLRCEREFGGLLVPGPPDPDALHEHFTSVHTQVRNRLRRLTSEQRAAVADLVDGPCERALVRLGQRRDPEALIGLAAAYPWSRQAVGLLQQAGDWQLEAGDASAAAWCYRQCLALQGDVPADPVTVLRCARALVLAGRATELRALADRLASTAPNLTLPGPGGPVPAPSELRRLGDAVRPAAEVWPEPDPDGGPGAEPPPLSRVQRTWAGAHATPVVMDLGMPTDVPAEPSPFLPVAADGVCVLNLGTTLAGIDLARLAFAWTTDGDDIGDTWDPGRTLRGTVWGAAITGDTVSAVLSEPLDRRGDGPNRLVLAGLRDGQARAPVLRSSTIVASGERDAETIFRFTGVPVWRGGRCYVVARRTHPGSARPDEAWLLTLRLDRAAARPAWHVVHRTFLTTEAKQQADRRLANAGTCVDAGDRLIVATHLGTLVAVDSLTGRIRWLVKYRLVGGSQQAEASFRAARPLVGPHTVVFGPADSDSLYVCDRDTGELIYGAVGERYDPAQYDAAIPPDRHSGPWRGVLGLRHDRLFVYRDRSIEILAPEQARVEGRRLVWSGRVRGDDQQVPVQGNPPGGVDPPRIMGRPAFGPHGAVCSGGSTLSLLGLRRVRDGGGTEQIALTGAPVDDVDLAAIPGPQGDFPGTRLAGACLRLDGWSVPVICRQRLPSAPDAVVDRCGTVLPRPRAGAQTVTCPRCRHAFAVRPVRYCVIVSRDFLTALQLAPR